MYGNNNTSKWDQIDQAFQGGGKSLFNRDTAPGTTYTGVIEDVEYRQTTDYSTQQPAYFPSGDPKMQFIIKLTGTGLQDGPDDDGNRTLYVNAWGGRKRALFQAIRDAGFNVASEALAPGNKLTATYVGETQQSGKSGAYTEKTYTYKIEKGTPAAAAIDNAFATQTAPQPATDPWAAPTPQQTPTATQQAPQAGGAGQVQALINQGMNDDQIAQATGLDATVVTVLRQQLAG